MNIQIAVAVLLFAASFAQPCAFGQSTVFDYAQKQALQEYPDLGVKDSVFNLAFLQAVREKTATDPAFFGHGEWPLTLARAIAPERVYLKFTVFQNVSDGSLLDAYSGTMGEVKKLVDWAAPSLLDGHRRADVKVEPGIIWSTQGSQWCLSQALKGTLKNRVAKSPSLPQASIVIQHCLEYPRAFPAMPRRRLLQCSWRGKSDANLRSERPLQAWAGSFLRHFASDEAVGILAHTPVGPAEVFDEAAELSRLRSFVCGRRAVAWAK